MKIEEQVGSFHQGTEIVPEEKPAALNLKIGLDLHPAFGFEVR